MAMCQICGKKPNYGHNVSHAKNHTNRRWMPNIQATHIQVDGEYQRVKICTRCLRTISKHQSAAANR